MVCTSLNLPGINYINVGNISSYTTNAAINVTQSGGLTWGGIVYINLYGTAPATSGTVTLMEYSGPLNGALNYQLSASFAGSRSTFTLFTTTDGTFTYINVAYGVDSPYWTGLGNGVWSTATQTPKNWALVSNGSATDYLEGDTVIFDDRANTTSATVTLGQNVNPTSVTFNNSSSVSYTITDGGPATASAAPPR